MDPRKSHHGDAQPGPSWAGSSRPQGRPNKPHLSRSRSNHSYNSNQRPFGRQGTSTFRPKRQVQPRIREDRIPRVKRDWIDKPREEIQRETIERVYKAREKDTSDNMYSSLYGSIRKESDRDKRKRMENIEEYHKNVDARLGKTWEGFSPKRELKEQVVEVKKEEEEVEDGEIVEKKKEEDPIDLELRPVLKEKQNVLGFKFMPVLPIKLPTIKIELGGWREVKSEVKEEVKEEEIEVEKEKEIKKEVRKKSNMEAETVDQQKRPPYPPELPHFTGNGYYSRLYKVVADKETNKAVKFCVKRFNGKCALPEHKKFDYPKPTEDPRLAVFRKTFKPPDLKIAMLTIDDGYKGIPPKREVTVSNLNDNISKDFLTNRAKNQDPEEVIVYFHPDTKKHLKMAMIRFKKSGSAREFVEANNGVKIMGDTVTCILDPFAAHLDSMYRSATGKDLPPLSHLEGMSAHELSLRREHIIGSQVKAEPAAAAPIEPKIEDLEEEGNKSLSPMDTSNSPPVFHAAGAAAAAVVAPPPLPPPMMLHPLPPFPLPPFPGMHHMPHLPPPFPPFPPMQHPQQLQQPQFMVDHAGPSSAAAAAAAGMRTPPYSELPPSDHRVERESQERRNESEKQEERSRREKRRRMSTSSSSTDSSNGEEHKDGVKKKKEEYLKVKRYISSERSNGEKRIVKRVKEVMYKRTEMRTTTRRDGGTASPDSFDEEMKRRERSMSRNQKSVEKRGRDEMRWSSPSSDSDERGGRRKKKGKDASETKSRERAEEKKKTPNYESTPLSMSTPGPSSLPSSVKRTKSRFDAPPPLVPFDPTQPPPTLMVPPVGLVLPDCSVPPPPLPPAVKLLPPPPLPGGYIPPPELFGLAPTPALLCAASAAAAGMTPLPPGPPPPSMVGGFTPGSGYSTPGRGAKHPLHSATANSSPLAASAAAAAAATAGMTRVGSAQQLSASMAAAAAVAARITEGRGIATPPPSEGGSTPHTATGTPKGEKKKNLDDRIAAVFGITTAKKEEEKKRESEMIKHASSAPSFSTISEVKREDSLDSDDMDVASSSDEKEMEGKREERETEEERKEREEGERRKREEQVTYLTKVTMEKLMADLKEQIRKDIIKKMEMTAFQTLDNWEKKQKNEEEEKKRQMIRDNLAAAAAREKSVVTPKKDPMEEMLAAKLLSPEGLTGGISNVFSGIKIMKQRNLNLVDVSRDGTPLSRDSRGEMRSKSPSESRSRSTSSSDEEGRRKKRRGSSSSLDSSSSESEEEEEKKRVSSEDEVRKVRRRPNMRNIESSQESSAASTSTESTSEESEEEEEKEERKASPLSDDEVDVMGMSEDEVEEKKKEIEESAPEPGPSTSSVDKRAESAAAAAAAVESEKVQSSVARAAAAAAAASAAQSAAAARLAAQQDLLLQQPSMRPEGRYDPVRYDHPYIRQLGVPFVEGRSRPVAPPARPQQELQQQTRPVAAATAAATAAAGAARAAPIVLPTQRPAVAATAAAAASSATPFVAAQVAIPKQPIKSKKDMQKRLEEDRVHPEILSLLQSTAISKKREEEERKERTRGGKVWKVRSKGEEERIRDAFKAGMDGEDEAFLRRALEEQQAGGKRPWGGEREVKWESRLRAFTPYELPKPAKHGKLDLYYDDEDLAGIVPHSTGCARSEGFYRLTFKQKIRIMRRPETAFQDRTEINERDEVVTRHQVQAQKEQRSMNRRLQTMVDSNPNSEFFKVNQLKYRKKMIKFARSRIHGWGLYALEPIAPDDMIVEYIGQKIRPIVADEREKQYERRGIGSSYLFRIDEDEVIDATKQGNFARFINHSCQPNCYAKVVTVDGDKRIVIYSKSLIQKGDEITYDYKFPLEEDKIECLCGAPLCRGTLN